MAPVPGDDELLEMLQKVEAREAALAHLTVEDETEELDEARDGDPCPFCGEPSLDFQPCSICEGQGCMPRDDWRPGWADPCLVRCVRCALLSHSPCGGVDEAGNPVCAACKPAHRHDDA